MLPSAFKRRPINVPPSLHLVATLTSEVGGQTSSATDTLNVAHTADKDTLASALTIAEARDASRGAVIFAILIQILAFLYLTVASYATFEAAKAKESRHRSDLFDLFIHIFALPPADSRSAEPSRPSLVHFLALLLLASVWNVVHYYTYGSSPGYVTVGKGSKRPDDDEGRFDEEGIELRWCSICGIWQPLRAKHCKQCARCVKKYDHHCFWVGTCVGEYNHFRFLVAVATGSLYLTFASLFLWHYYVFWREVSYHRPSHCAHPPPSTSQLPSECFPPWAAEHPVAYNVITNAFPAVCAIVTSALAAFCLILWGFHLMLCLSNQTTWEISSASKITYLRKAPRAEPFSASGALISQRQTVAVYKEEIIPPTGTTSFVNIKSSPRVVRRSQSVPLVDPSLHSMSPQIALAWAIECCRRTVCKRPPEGASIRPKPPTRSIVASAALGFAHNIFVLLWVAAVGGKDLIAKTLIELALGIQVAEGQNSRILCRFVRRLFSKALHFLCHCCCFVSYSDWEELREYYSAMTLSTNALMTVEVTGDECSTRVEIYDSADRADDCTDDTNKCRGMGGGGGQVRVKAQDEIAPLARSEVFSGKYPESSQSRFQLLATLSHLEALPWTRPHNEENDFRWVLH